MQSIIIVDDMNEHIQYIKNIIQDMSYLFVFKLFIIFKHFNHKSSNLMMMPLSSWIFIRTK